MQSLTSLSLAHLACVLDALDVQFLANEQQLPVEWQITPSMLLRSLAMSDDARMRLAIIPLLLRHPEFAFDAQLAVEQLAAEAQIFLKCYYTAAYLLQRKYLNRLQHLFGSAMLLPNLFGSKLGLTELLDVDEGLRKLAQRQQALSGRSINWLGTYEHGAQRLLTRYERKQTWQN